MTLYIFADSSHYTNDKCRKLFTGFRNGKVSFVNTYFKNNIAFGTKAVFTCNQNYQLQGFFYITCKATEEVDLEGMWDDEAPQCVVSSRY